MPGWEHPGNVGSPTNPLYPVLIVGGGPGDDLTLTALSTLGVASHEHGWPYVVLWRHSGA